MARNGAKYHAFNGAKLEYCATQSGSYTRIYGLSNIPDIGGTPNKIDTTDLDNTEFETSIMGLKPALELDFEFNMEDPGVNANIKIASDLEDSNNDYYWKLTYPNGIVVAFVSKVRTTIMGGASQDLQKFTMHLAPNSEPTITIPTASL